MFVEDVEVDGRHDRIAQRVLLVECAHIASGFRVVPRAPLVHHQPDALLRIVLVHDRAVLLDQLVNAQCAGERRMPFLFAELCRGTFLSPVAGGQCVVV